jgi:hypothetical protein
MCPRDRNSVTVDLVKTRRDFLGADEDGRERARPAVVAVSAAVVRCGGIRGDRNGEPLIPSFWMNLDSCPDIIHSFISAVFPAFPARSCKSKLLNTRGFA